MVMVRSLRTVMLMDAGMRRLQLRQNRADAIHGFDDVGARLAEDIT